MYTVNMLNEVKPNFWPEERIGLPFEKYMSLSDNGKTLYNQIYDYCTYASDPQYKTLHKFRKKIDSLVGLDRELLIEYFNNDPAIQWPGIPRNPWEYYNEPY